MGARAALTRADPGGPRAVTVDLWHTLLEVRSGSLEALLRVRESAWVEPLREAGWPGPAARRAVRAMRTEAERIQSAGRSVSIPAQAQLLRRRTGVTVAPEAVESAIGGAALRARVRAAPGALVALGWLRRSGIRLGLVSNILSEPPEAIRVLVERSGLSDALDQIYLSAEHRYAKPSPTPFRMVLRSLGARPSEAVHFGDHSDDVVGALAAGLAPVRYIGLLAQYPAERASALGRIPPDVPTLGDWRQLPRRWEALVAEARAAREGRSRPSARRARSARAG